MKQNNFPDPDIPKLKSVNFANIFNIYTDDNFSSMYFYNINKTLNFEGLPEDPNDDYTNNIFDYYDIETEDTWTTISYKQYDTIELWWLVCKANNIANPTVTPKVGARIRTFKKDYLEGILSSIREG